MPSRLPDTRLWLAVVLLALGCGGKLDGDDASKQRPTSPETAEGSEPPASGKPPQGTTPLADCEPGFNPVREPERSCNWTVDGQCYEDKLAACACACPASSQDTVCSSDFPLENGRVPVSCF